MLGVLAGLLGTVRIFNSERELGVKPRDKVQLRRLTDSARAARQRIKLRWQIEHTKLKLPE